MDAPSAVQIQAQRGPLWPWLGTLPVLTASFLSKLSVPPFGALGLSIAAPLLSAASALGLLTGRLLVDPARFLAYAGLMSLLWIVQVVRGDAFSVMSMLLLCVLHFPYFLRLAPRPDYARVIGWFQAAAVVLACCGLAQFSLQFVIGPQLAFPIENFFPKALLTSRFNAQGYLEYGSSYFRTNGIFLQEPSFFSQFLAVAIVVELATRMRWRVLALLAIAIVVSYSGTGLIILAVCLPVWMIARGRLDLLLAGLVALVGVVLVASLAEAPFVRVFFSRAGEFTSQGSSGFARFVGGFYMFEQFLWPEPLRALFGYGAGSIDDYAARATLPSGGNALFKMVFEFGLLGGGAYFAFLAWCIVRCGAPAMIKLAVSMTYLLGGIYIPFSHGLVLGLLLWPDPPARKREPDQEVS